MEIVKSIKFVDKVIPEYGLDGKIDDIKKYSVNIFVIGDDRKGIFDYLKDYCEVVYLPRTKGISTTQLKKSLNLFPSILKI